jgi:hypothetical protein
MGVGGQRHTPAALPPGKRPGTHCTGGFILYSAEINNKWSYPSTPPYFFIAYVETTVYFLIIFFWCYSPSRA